MVYVGTSNGILQRTHLLLSFLRLQSTLCQSPRTKPFDKIQVLPIVYFAIQNFFNLCLIFIVNINKRRWVRFSSFDSPISLQKWDIKYIMDVFQCIWKIELIRLCSNAFYNAKRAVKFVIQLFWEAFANISDR